MSSYAVIALIATIKQLLQNFSFSPIYLKIRKLFYILTTHSMHISQYVLCNETTTSNDKFSEKHRTR